LIGSSWSENTSRTNLLAGTWMIFIIMSNPDNWRFQGFQDAYDSSPNEQKKFFLCTGYICFGLQAVAGLVLFYRLSPWQK
jgi:hypothetical protein